MSLCVCQGMSVHTCVCSSGSVYVFPHDLCARIGDLCVCVCGGLCLLVCMHKVAMCVRVAAGWVVAMPNSQSKH